MHQASNATIFLTGKAFIADARTKGDNLEFTTPSVEATIFENGSRDCARGLFCAVRSYRGVIAFGR